MTLADRVQEAADPEAPQEQQLSPTQFLVQRMRDMTDNYAIALGGNTAGAERLVHDAITALRTTRNLHKAEPMSVLGALMTAAQLNLRVGVLGECWILPFWNNRASRHQAQFIMGYRGLATLAHRTGLVHSLVARTVYDAEMPNFTLEYHADRDVLVHKPHLGADKGRPALFYARALLANGGYQLTRPSTVQEMLEYREDHASARDKNGNVVGPWIEHFEQMCWKTHVRWVSNLLPKSVDLAMGLAADESVRTDLNPRADIAQASESVTERVVDGHVLRSGAPEAAPSGDEHPGRPADTETRPQGGRRG